MTNDIHTFVIDFPVTCVAEMVRQNEDGSYTILLNAKMSHERLQKAYLHALGHITHNDFEKSDIQEIEYEAHRRDAV